MEIKEILSNSGLVNFSRKAGVSDVVVDDKVAKMGTDMGFKVHKDSIGVMSNDYTMSYITGAEAGKGIVKVGLEQIMNALRSLDREAIQNGQLVIVKEGSPVLVEAGADLIVIAPRNG